MHSTFFQHEPIDTRAQQIRLITILPTVDPIVRCRIKTFELGHSATPDYRALSYTWGPPSPVRTIEVDGKLFVVRQNLYNFMNNFRARLVEFSGKEEEQWLWIDQICIDQARTKERNHQVEMMSEIYRRAHYVYLWLGASNQKAEAAIRALKIHFHDSNQHPQISNLGPRPDEDLAIFFNNPYWRRLWIVQEVMLARYNRIFCGDTLVSWKELSRFCTIRTLDYIPKQLRWLAKNAPTGDTFSFPVLFDIFGDNLCEDPSDKVYALLGIVHPKERIKVDYEKPSNDKFIEAANLILSGKLQSHPDLFKAVHENDYDKSPDRIFMNAVVAMMNEARQETGLRLMDAVLTLASQMRVKLPYEHNKEAAEARDNELQNVWTGLAQAYVALYAKDENQNPQSISITSSESCIFLANEYKMAVEMTKSFFDMLLGEFLDSVPNDLSSTKDSLKSTRVDFRWRTQDNLLKNLDAVHMQAKAQRKAEEAIKQTGKAQGKAANSEAQLKANEAQRQAEKAQREAEEFLRARIY
jgi:hypothetical protein